MVDGRNIWKSNLQEKIDFVKDNVSGDVIIASSCPLLHSPYDLELEQKVPAEIKRWLSFAKQKLQELSVIKGCVNEGSHKAELESNTADVQDRKTSKLIHDDAVKNRIKTINQSIVNRKSSYPERAVLQKEIFALPKYPTTTIGSFPQTTDVRQARAKFKRGELDGQSYDKFLEEKTIDTIKKQEEIGIDVIVHGEFERNDMVEYFGEQLKGFTFTSSGFVQSYGSRCVKPQLFLETCLDQNL